MAPHITRMLIGSIIGGILGYLFYRFIGCASGTCPITGNPFIATVYGALLGALMSGGK